MDAKREESRSEQVSDLAPADEAVDGDAAEKVKGGLLSASALGTAPILKSSTQVSSSVDPGKVQGFQCDGRL